MNRIILLGPQRSRPTVADALEALDDDGPVAVISAGWQEREGEFDALAEHVPGIELVDLGLYVRADEIFEKDTELRNAWRERQDWLKELQRLYRRRLRYCLKAARELNNASGIDTLVEEARAGALAAVRDLDEMHLRRIRKIQLTHWQDWPYTERPLVIRHRKEIAEQLEPCKTVLIAGGHVGVLLNRLRLFDTAKLIAPLSIVAWSAGAMALSEKVVLFHDFPPQGAGDAEVFDAGLAAFSNTVVFPDAQKRLELGNQKRVALLAGRLEPANCITLEENSMLIRDGDTWQIPGPASKLSSDGTVGELTP